MNAKRKYISKLAIKFCAVLVAAIFLAIPLAQSFHKHPVQKTFTKSVADKSIAQAVEKCAICDYTAEIKGKQILLSHPTIVDVPTTTISILNTFVYTRIYKFTLQNFTNKGPPYLLG